MTPEQELKRLKQKSKYEKLTNHEIEILNNNTNKLNDTEILEKTELNERHDSNSSALSENQIPKILEAKEIKYRHLLKS